MSLLVPFCAAAADPGEATPTEETSGAPAEPRIAHADLKARDGRDIGHVRLTETPLGVILRLRMSLVEEGTHAFHVHEIGKCEAAGGFSSAGGHLNPTSKAHGFASQDGPHAGDLPNLEISDTSKLEVSYFLPALTLGTGKMGLLDEDGSAIVVHERPDDYESQPAGDADGRLACGVVELGGETGAEEKGG